MDRHHDAAALLLSARRDRTQRLNVLPDIMRPRTTEQAYLVQRAVARTLGPIGGWKVGSPSPTAAAFTCAPLPASGITDSPAHADCRDRGVEAEIALRLGRDLPPRDAPYTDAEIEAAIASAHPAIEVLESRYTNADAVDALSNLADSLSHHSLVLGPAIPDWRAIDLQAEEVRVFLDETEVKLRTGNPAGGMTRLLRWLADTGTRWAGGLRAGQVVTTGSWTGKDFAQQGGLARISFARCGDASVRFAS